MKLLIKAELKKMKRLKITYVGYISILLSSLITYIQVFTMSGGTITFLNFTDMYLYNNALLFFPFMYALLGGSIIDREYALDTRKNLLVIPVKWHHMIKAKIFVLILLVVYFSFLSAVLAGIVGFVLECPDFTIFMFLKKGLSFFILGISICIGILPIILWFSRMRGKYIWGSIMSALLGITGVFVVNEKMVNWHPITYSFSIISLKFTDSLEYGVVMSFTAFIIYILVSFQMYWLIYWRKE